MRNLVRRLILWAVPEAAEPRHHIGNGRYISFDPWVSSKDRKNFLEKFTK